MEWNRVASAIGRGDAIEVGIVAVRIGARGVKRIKHANVDQVLNTNARIKVRM